MDSSELKQRTMQFGLRTIRMVETLPRSRAAEVVGKQLLRSSTSVGANYRSACRGQSRADFIAKASISIEEADESIYWMEILIDSGMIKEELVSPLMQEGNEIIAILTASVKTAKSNLQAKKPA